jgi:uncharacterized protein YukE
MASSGMLTGSPEQLQTAASNTYACLEGLESQLQALAGCRDGLQAAVQSQHTGQAIYQTLDNAWTQGKGLAQTLSNIMDVLKKSATNLDTADLNSAGKVAAQMGQDSYNAASTISGGHHSVDVGTWS